MDKDLFISILVAIIVIFVALSIQFNNCGHCADYCLIENVKNCYLHCMIGV